MDELIKFVPPTEEKCTFVGCQNFGVPQSGYDFYVCDDCFAEFGRLVHEKLQAKHENN